MFVIVYLRDGECLFWTGSTWQRDYADAATYEKKTDAQRVTVDNPRVAAKWSQIVKDYGTDGERSVLTRNTVQLCVACGLPATSGMCRETDGPHVIVRTVGGMPGVGGSKTVQVGDRVRVKIANRDAYANGAADALDGMTGKIERFKADGEALVAFDKPAPRWWPAQTPATGFWFPPSDLVRL